MKLCLYYIMMTEPESKQSPSTATTPTTTAYDVDNCKHRLVYGYEWVCCRCGRVFTADEAEELQRGAGYVTTVTTHEDLGLDPHGKTPLWLHGLGTIEGYKHSLSENRDDISILSNIVDKLRLPSYASIEFLQLYKSFIKDRKKDMVYAAVLALLEITARYEQIGRRLRVAASDADTGNTVACIDYICTIVENQFGAQKNLSARFRVLYNNKGLIQRIARIARRKGASTALDYSMEVI